MPSEPLFKRPKPQAYFSYDHQKDGGYYDLSQRLFSSVCDITRDRSMERELGADDPEAYLRALKEGAMAGTGCTVVLCGERTHLDPFVDWEIKATLDGYRGLLAVALPGMPSDPSGAPILPARLKDNWDGGYAVLCGWRDLVDGRIDLTHRIAFATARDPDLILNSRELVRPG
jgi:hypothetical protein